MILPPADQLTKADIDNLVNTKVAELRTLEYKETLDANTDGEKKEFLADVSSLATAGGYLIYGIGAERLNNKPTGAPKSAPGLTMKTTTDAEILRLHNIIRDGIERRLPGVTIAAIDGFPKGPVIVIHVPKSFLTPHMVTFGGTSRFYSRNSAGKWQLSEDEIRAAYAQSLSVPESIRRWRLDRIGHIVARETNIPLKDGPKVILHVFPVNAALGGQQVDVDDSVARNVLLRPMYGGITGGRYNFDGYIHYTGYDDGAQDGYVQLYSNGCIEAVDVDMLAGDLSVPDELLEGKLIDGVTVYLRLLKTLDVTAPVAVMVTLLGVRDYKIASRLNPRYGLTSSIDRDDLLIPEIMVDDLDLRATDILRPALNAIWRAAGFDGCHNYDADGQWKGRAVN